MPAAIGMHIGLGIVCFSAVYTGWQKSIITYPQWAAILLVAGILLYAGFSRRPGLSRETWVQLTLALGGLFALRLCYDPQLESISRLGEELPVAFLDTYPGIALVGIAIAVISWLLYRTAGGQMDAGVIPFRRSTLVATGLVVALAAFNYFMLHRAHDLMLSETLRPILTILQGGLLAAVLLSIGGGTGVRKSPHIYIALTLIAAFLRNMAFPME